MAATGRDAEAGAFVLGAHTRNPELALRELRRLGLVVSAAV
jgi:hypothetical protein